MKTLSGCQGKECTVEATLPLLGPVIALAAMLVVAAGTAVTMMVG